MGRVGRYRIRRAIARGGMAEVFEAVAEGDGGFERRVALKRILLQDGDDGAALERMFLDEARIASQLHHANIVSVLDYGFADGLPFQVLELVDGTHLGALARRGASRGRPMPEAVALHICAEVAHGLAHAHGRVGEDGSPLGIVHRDVSPSNVLISWDGDVKLSDFGIAFAHDRREQTADGVTKGKLSYMSPEQASGGRVDARSDVFSLGCVLHTLLANRSPLSSPGAFAALFSGDDVPLEETLAADVSGICAKAISAEPSARYATASEMAEALEKAAATRLRRGPKTVLREWLSGLRPEPKQRPKLDGMLDLAMLIDGDPSASRSYRTVQTEAAQTEAAQTEAARTEAAQTEAAQREAAQTEAAQTEAAQTEAAQTEAAQTEAEAVDPTDRASPDSPSPVSSEARRRRSTGPLVMLMVALLGLGAAGLWVWGGGLAAPPETHAPPSDASAALAAPPTPEVADTEDASEAPAEADPTPPLEGATPPEPRAAEAPQAPRPRRTRRAVETSAPVARAPRTEAAPRNPGSGTGRAFLLVGGAGALRAAILVDGTIVGYAPRRLELPQGTHRLELQTPDGERLGPTSMVLNERHTRISPARWIVE